MPTPLLQINNLSVYFHPDPYKEKLFALRDVSFVMHQGESVAVVGESGSGKTMLGLSIIELLPLSAYIEPNAQVKFENVDLFDDSESELQAYRGSQIGFVFQEPATAFNPVLTIGQQITEVFNHTKLPSKQKRTKAIKLLEEVGIPNASMFFNYYPDQLSGGLKQRAMIAMALAGEPKLLIADEPTTALDVTLQTQILDLLRSLQRAKKMTMLYITHDLSVAAHVADKIIVLRKGEIVEMASTASFLKGPEHRYSKALLAAVPKIATQDYPTIPVDAQPLLTAKNLRIYFDIKKGFFRRTVDYVRAVDDVSINLFAGRTLALVGGSGSGKTTLAKGIMQLLSLKSGQFFWQGKKLDLNNAEALKKWRQDIQFIFQDPFAAMDPRMTIFDILCEGLLINGIKDKPQQEEKITEILKRVGLGLEAKDKYPHEFSGGQRQRICIARALIMKPKIIICDEPTSALDVITQRQILNLLRDIQQELNVAYLLITHNMSVVADMAHEIAVMANGKIVETGMTNEVLTQPKHAYTKKLLASVLQLPTE